MTQYQDEQGIWHSKDTLGNPVYWDTATGQWVQENLYNSYYPLPPQKPWYRRTGPLIGVGAACLFFALVVGAAIGGGAQEITSGPAPTAAAPVQPEPEPPAPVEPAPVAPDPAEVRAECVAPALVPFQAAVDETQNIQDYLRAEDTNSLRSAASTFGNAADALRSAAAGCQDPQVTRALSTGARAMDALSSSCRNAARGIDNLDVAALREAVSDAKRGSALLSEANSQLNAAGVGS